MTLEDATRYVGVFVALLGTIVSFVAGFSLVLRLGRATALAAIRSIVSAIRVRFARREPPRPTSFGSAESITGAGATVEAGALLDWGPKLPMPERVAAIERMVLDLNKSLGNVQRSTGKRFSRGEEEMRRLKTSTESELKALWSAGERKDVTKAQIDALALPSIGAGVILTGVPELISRLPAWLWTGSMALIVAWSLVASWRGLLMFHRSNQRPGA